MPKFSSVARLSIHCMDGSVIHGFLIIVHGQRPWTTLLSSMGDFVVHEPYSRPRTFLSLLRWFMILSTLLGLDDPYGRIGDELISRYPIKPYPKNYKTPIFVCYDGRKGNAIEHVSKFLNTMGQHAGNEELCQKEFSKSLTDRAYTWYTRLPPGSIRTWDEMVDSFYHWRSQHGARGGNRPPWLCKKIPQIKLLVL